jgi:hypothetical protein
MILPLAVALVSASVVLFFLFRPGAKPEPPATKAPGVAAPALVQVESGRDALPHAGLQRANYVYEYLTEGGITRFTAIYLRPSGSTRIEPVRSARLITLRLQKAYGGVLFYSGASNQVARAIRESGLPALTEDTDGGRYFARDPARRAPHNLFTTEDQLRQGLEKYGGRVTYELQPRGTPSGKGDPVTNVRFQQTPSHQVAYTYAPNDRAYLYSSELGPEVDVAQGGQPVKVVAVVLVRVSHHGVGYPEDVTGAEGIDFDLQGSGPADLYAGGLHYAVKWDASEASRPLRLRDADAKIVALPQGLVWIHFVDPNMPVQAS